MSFERRGRMPLDYLPVVYPGSVMRFRGPGHRIDQPHLLCLGGSETFGRFIHTPYPAQLDAILPLPVVNMGVPHAGLDVIMGDRAIRDAISHATAIVLQVPGAQNMSNRFYGVHPRRNDRFIRASTMLRSIYPDVDFTECHYTRHLLAHLQGRSAERFGVIMAELRRAWVARMTRFLQDCPVPVHLLWLSRRAPDQPGDDPALGRDPLFVTPVMLTDVARHAAALHVVVPPPDLDQSTGGMFFMPGEIAAARALPGPCAHDDAAALLYQALRHDPGR